MSPDKPLLLVRGGGDLATGVALRLYRAGLQLVISELAQPLAVRRAVAFAEAVYEGWHTVEGITARLVERDQLAAALDAGEIPVVIDPAADILSTLRHGERETNRQGSAFHFLIVVDARLIKQPPDHLPANVPLHIGLGPGFHAGRDCHAVIETRRSHTLGRVVWEGTAQPDSGEPEGDSRRVLRAPVGGTVTARKKIGDRCEAGEVVAVIDDQVPVVSSIGGVLRGMIRDGLHVPKGLKIGDVDPRNDVSACYLASDKALAIGGGVLEAILSRPEIRSQLWDRYEQV
jgi:xanthine dehydrogenase accessory factor